MSSPQSISSVDEFRGHVAELVARPGWTAPAAYALGIATSSTVGDGTKVLDTYYPVVNRDENVGFAALVLDVAGHRASLRGMRLALTTREFDLLVFLMSNPGEAFTREQLLERVWGYDRYIETRSVDVHVGRLRAKLGTAGRQIETVVGLGYRFVE